MKLVDQMKNKISTVIITKNEEANIVRCLKSISWVDEIVVVDSYSQDNTVEICRKYNCKVIQNKWMGFGKNKKLAVEQASNSWILSIDADEEVTEALKLMIEKILEDPKFNGYNIKRTSFYLGKKIKYCGWNRDFPLRLFNKKFGNFNEKEVHESVKIIGEKRQIESPLFHYTYPTINSHIRKMNLYSELSAAELINKGKHYSILSSVIFGIAKFVNMYFIKLGILDGKVGFILCYNSAFGIYLKYVKTWRIKK